MEYNYFYLKNTHSYDRAIAMLKYLSEEHYNSCCNFIYRFISENFYTKIDYLSIHKDDFSSSFILKENILNFQKYREQLFPNINVSIHFKNNFFYLLFENLNVYELTDYIQDNKIISIQEIPVPDLTSIYEDFYLSNIFFDSSKINFSNFSPFSYRPDIETRAKNQIKIILQEQLLQKNNNISTIEILKINETVASTENIILIEKIKSALLKADHIRKLNNN